MQQNDSLVNGQSARPNCLLHIATRVCPAPSPPPPCKELRCGASDADMSSSDGRPAVHVQGVLLPLPKPGAGGWPAAGTAETSLTALNGAVVSLHYCWGCFVYRPSGTVHPTHLEPGGSVCRHGLRSA